MQNNAPVFQRKRQQRNAALWGLMALEGIIALAASLRIPSEPGSAVLWGYSLSRIVITGAAGLGVLILGLFSAAALRQPAWWRRVSSAVLRFCETPTPFFILSSALFTLFLSVTALLALAVSPAALELVILRALLERLGLILAWAALVILQVSALLVLNTDPIKRAGTLSSSLRRAVLFGLATLVYVIALKIFTTATWDLRMRHVDEFIYLPALLFFLWGGLHQFFGERAWYARASRWLLLLSIGVVTYTVYRHTAQWMAWENTPAKSYWNLLADAFLHGRLFLITPESTHDLTLYNGLWYVPNPPLPALVLLPYAAIFGAETVNMVLFSILFGAANAVLVYMLLEQASQMNLIPTRRSGNLWLTALFALGTPHWWLALIGQMWFVSQILTLTFAALAVLFVLRKYPAWLAGVGLGLAMLSRPNVFTLWPLLVGVAIYLDRKTHRTLRWKNLINWAIQSALPVCLAVGGLLYYNHIRFDNWFDFGYVTINGADWILEAVRNYGMFHIHFLPINLNIMLLKLPGFSLQNGCFRYIQTYDGISIFAATPALLYLFRRIKINLWTISAWVSILLSAGMVLFYHNTGAWQVGYRYVMDFLLPLLLLLAIAIGQRASWLFKTLTILSILISAMGIVWWFQMWPC